MFVITLQREKCIGCNYCAEHAPEFFRMSRKDGKSTLLRAQEKKGFHTARTPLEHAKAPLEKAAAGCPVRIIKLTEL